MKSCYYFWDIWNEYFLKIVLSQNIFIINNEKKEEEVVNIKLKYYYKLKNYNFFLIYQFFIKY